MGKRGQPSWNKGLTGKFRVPVKNLPWSDDFYVRAYDLAAAGESDRGIAKDLGMDKMSFRRAVRDRPALKEALERGRRAREAKEESFADYCYGNLPKKLQRVWDRIAEAGQVGGADGAEMARRARLLLDKGGERMKQVLFLHALVCLCFNASEACRAVGVPRSSVRRWLKEDPRFAELVVGVQDVKKDFFEGRLVALVQGGDASATIFANRTLNRDRGYSDKVNVQIEGEVRHKHSLEDLNLSLETRRELLEKIRQRDAKPALEDRSAVQDAEFEER